MKVAINHLTRKSEGYICVGAVSREVGHVRPILRYEQIPRNKLGCDGGPFSLGAVVDLGPVTPAGDNPHVEDVVFEPYRVRKLHDLPESRFLSMLDRLSVGSLETAFGPELERLSPTAAAIPDGIGGASLEVIRIRGGGRLRSRETSRGNDIRFKFDDPRLGRLDLKVTDVRLWEPDHRTPSGENIASIQGCLDGSYLSVGLTRAYAVPMYRGPRHWLQINNVFPVDNPLWTRS